jgi:hypothetical protein
MPKMFVNSAVALSRDGKRLLPPVGKVFNFTADEVKEITRLSPRALRVPINESGETEASEDDATDSSKAGSGGTTDKTTPKAPTPDAKPPAKAPAKAPDTKGL